ncbi:hypothetical protein GQR60_01140 [Labilibaculum sp. A4]|uniref:Uncharacterized protein n=2 Tax=Labilibaculum TaxID=2060722 RepID=A0A425YH00_9BACT|nr:MULTISPECIES: hypothetical protein [Labilibaculum]MDQ1769418.1 hypothetical protein [Labilibaculum euxinus]MUP38799.1 hypothetical protein [Labilibaculum euxinus]MVB08004.1 hypothetical protein [Labilibaculum euxinus]MWN74944.1 hypothetical protein [Labilibaculum euxinus]PKQ64575.1 hypothetical protein BZG01_14415 [Labilibaculum manganireducens]
MDIKNEELRDVCQEALECLNKPGNDAYNELKSKLEYVIGSYNFDKNPVGLFEIGNLALIALEEISAEKPRKVKKALLKNLKESLLQKVEA